MLEGKRASINDVKHPWFGSAIGESRKKRVHNAVGDVLVKQYYTSRVGRYGALR